MCAFYFGDVTWRRYFSQERRGLLSRLYVQNPPQENRESLSTRYLPQVSFCRVDCLKYNRRLGLRQGKKGITSYLPCLCQRANGSVVFRSLLPLNHQYLPVSTDCFDLSPSCLTYLASVLASNAKRSNLQWHSSTCTGYALLSCWEDISLDSLGKPKLSSYWNQWLIELALCIAALLLEHVKGTAVQTTFFQGTCRTGLLIAASGWLISLPSSPLSVPESKLYPNTCLSRQEILQMPWFLHP